MNFADFIFNKQVETIAKLALEANMTQEDVFYRLGSELSGILNESVIDELVLVELDQGSQNLQDLQKAQSQVQKTQGQPATQQQQQPQQQNKPGFIGKAVNKIGQGLGNVWNAFKSGWQTGKEMWSNDGSQPTGQASGQPQVDASLTQNFNNAFGALVQTIRKSPVSAQVYQRLQQLQNILGKMGVKLQHTLPAQPQQPQQPQQAQPQSRIAGAEKIQHGWQNQSTYNLANN